MKGGGEGGGLIKRKSGKWGGGGKLFQKQVRKNVNVLESTGF